MPKPGQRKNFVSDLTRSMCMAARFGGNAIFANSINKGWVVNPPWKLSLMLATHATSNYRTNWLRACGLISRKRRFSTNRCAPWMMQQSSLVRGLGRQLLRKVSDYTKTSDGLYRSCTMQDIGNHHWYGDSDEQIHAWLQKFDELLFEYLDTVPEIWKKQISQTTMQKS